MDAASLDSKAEEQLSNEERLAWLRARGVVIEEPASRTSAPTAAKSGRTFRYVKIPADETVDCEEHSGPTCEGDALPSLLGPQFAGGSVSDDVLRAKAAETGQAVSLSAMRAVLARGGAEKFRLAVPTERNGLVAVEAYLDEASALKGLPTNKRASVLAHECGFPQTCQLCGDIFIGRLKWSGEGLVENVDFLLCDLEHSSLWLRRAATENLEHQKESNPDEHALAQTSVSPDGPASGVGEGYTWTDQNEELEVLVQVASGTSRRDVSVTFKRREICMSRPTSLSLKLFKPVEVDGCSWVLSDGKVVITLEKADVEPWPQLVV